MAVDQLHNLNLFREMLTTTNNYGNGFMSNPMINHVIAGGGSYNDNNNPMMMNGGGDSFLLRHVYNGKLPPPVKDDSGVTFNDSIAVLPPSRKRSREPMVLPAAIISGGRNVDVSKEYNGFSFFSEDMSLQIMQQQLELDRLVCQHMEKIRIEISERKKHQLRRIMAVIEDATSEKMREKDDEISKLLKINFDLEEKAKTLNLQSQIWQNVAHTNEATANTLRSNLEQVLHQVSQNDVVADDAVSCCGSGGEGEDEEAESGCGKEGERWIYRGKKEQRCRKCGEGESRVLVLPCRHLCLCTMCGPTLNSCPVCHSVKNASIHVNFS